MDTTHIIENGTVTNTIMASVAEAQVAYPNAICIQATTGSIGWAWDGEKLMPPPAATPHQAVTTPHSVTALQCLLAIDDAGLGPAYQAWASSAERSFAERAFIDKAQTWRRNDPTLLAAASAFGLSDEDLDTLFAAAAQISP